MSLERYLTEDREVPFEDAATFSVMLRRREPAAPPEPVLTKEAKVGILKLMLAKHAEGEKAEQLQAAMMVDPQVQRALDFREAQAAASQLSQQNQQLQQQLQAQTQGMQQLQQQAQAGQQENQQLQQQLQGEMQMRQQANMTAMQAQDQALKTQAASQQQRMQLAQTADQMAIQLKQVAAQDPVQNMQQQEQQQVAQQEQQKAQERAAMPAKQRKELEEAEKAQQNAQQQTEQAEQAQQQQAQQQQAQQQQQQGGMVAQSSAGMSKVDILKEKIAVAKAMLKFDPKKFMKDFPNVSSKGSRPPMPGHQRRMTQLNALDSKHSGEKVAAGIQDAYRAGRTMSKIKKTPIIGKRLGTHDSEDLKAVGMSLPERAAFRTGEHRDKLLIGGGVAGAAGLGAATTLAVQKSKEKNSELTKKTCAGKVKSAMLPMPSSAMKTRLIEAGLGAGLGAATGAAYEAARQRFSQQTTDTPSPAEVALSQKNRAAEITANNSPTLINRLAATKTLAQLDAERSLRKNPNKAILRRALQGAFVGAVSAPTVSAARKNLGPRIMGR